MLVNGKYKRITFYVKDCCGDKKRTASVYFIHKVDSQEVKMFKKMKYSFVFWSQDIE